VAQAVQEENELAQQGYKGILPLDLVEDIVMDNHDYDPKRILSEVFPNMPAKHGTFFPGYKYLNGVGITSIAELK
jgi:hypothetical protein